MKSFPQSAPGRLLTVAVAAPMLASGFVRWSPEGSGLFWIVAVMTLSITLAIFGIGLAVEEFPAHAVASLLVLPPGLFALVLGIGVLAKSTPAVGYAMTSAGALLLLLLLFLARAKDPGPGASETTRRAG